MAKRITRLQQARILTHRFIGGSYWRLVLQAPAAAAAARPGQFVMLRVSENQDPFLARPLGIASLPTKTSIELIYRVAGRGTSLLTHEKAGQVLDLLGPLGNGFPLPAARDLPVLVSGGSGFPPIHFLACHIGRSRSSLLIGTRDKAALPPASILRSFAKHCAPVFFATDDGSKGKKGLVTDLLAEYLAGADRADRLVIYACGPKPMLRAVSLFAQERSLRCYVSLEERMACGVGACMGCSAAVKAGGYQRICKEGPVFDARDILWDAQSSSEFGVRGAGCGCEA